MLYRATVLPSNIKYSTFQQKHILRMQRYSNTMVHRSRSPGFQVKAQAEGDNPLDLTTANEPLITDSGQSASKLSTATIQGVATACCGAFLFGYHLAVINGPLQQLATDLGFGSNTTLQGLVVSTLLAGAAVGSLLGAAISDRLGRRLTLQLDCIPLIAGAILAASSIDLTGILAARLLTGLGLGLSSALVPTYINEIAPSSRRGELGTLNQLLICIGILAALVLNLALPVTQWRQLFVFAVLPVVLLFFGLSTSVESPSWLLSKNRQVEAYANADKLWGNHDQLENNDVEDGSGSTSEEATIGNNIPYIIIGCGLFVFQQLSGINAIVYFSSTVFRQVGISSDALASAIVGLTNVTGTAIAAKLIENKGRLSLLTSSFAGMGGSMLLLVAGLSVPWLQPVVGPCALLATVLYVMSFSLGAGPVPALMVPELLPTNIRGLGVSLALTTHWVCNFGLGQLFLDVVNMVGQANVYLFFACTCFLGVAATQKLLVETKGKGFEQVQSEMKSKW